jgi:energy-coupling factor transporter ATP-binding protein EcfA2
MTQTAPPPAPKKPNISKSGALYFDLSHSEMIGKLILRLKRNSIVVITGESGRGKSTFVRETLCNELLRESKENPGEKTYRIAITEPYADPIGHLADAMFQPDSLFSPKDKDPAFRTFIENELRKGGDAIARLCEKAAEENGKVDFNFLLIVDQKQELFRYQNIMKDLGKSRDDLLYISLLLEAIKTKSSDEFKVPIYIVFVANTNNFEYFSRYRGLPEIMNTYNTQLPDVSKAELLKALEVYTDESGLREKWCNEFEQMSKSGDPFALQKLNLFLSLKADPALKDTYGLEGEMSGIIEKFIENQVWQNFSDDQKKQVECLFKALTFKNGIKNDRTPLKIETLQQWSEREGTMTIDEIKKLLQSFNQYNQTFILIKEWQPNTVVDIYSDALIRNWPLLQTWIDEENDDALVYKNLIRAGLKYFAEVEIKASENQPDNPIQESARNMHLFKKWVSNALKNNKENPEFVQDKLLYKGAILDSVRTLIGDSNNDPDRLQFFRQWASRYKSTTPDEQEKTWRAILEDRNLVKMNDLDIAIKFYKICDNQEKAEEDRKADAMKKEQMLRKRSQNWSIAATIALVVAGIALFRSYQANLNIKMIDYARLLDANDMLYPTNEERYVRMSKIFDIVKSRKISNWDMMLNALTNSNYLQLDIPDPALKDISTAALLNIQHFSEARLTDSAEKEYTQELDSIYERAIRYPTTQFPAVYHALLSELKEHTKDGKIRPRTANIEKNALVSNPHKAREFAFGDKNGRVFIMNGIGLDTLPEMGALIQGMCYSADGNRLYVSTQGGDIGLYDLSQFPIQKNIIYDDTKSIYFVAECSPGVLLVNSRTDLFLLEFDPKTKKKKNVGSVTPTGLGRVTQLGWSADHRWVLATGKDSTLVYALDPSHPNASQRIQKTITIQHTGTTMLDFDIKFDSINGVPSTVWLALGSERGDVWIMHKPLQLLAPGRINLADFEQYRDTLEHRSSITGLEFNPKLPQLASSSRDGRVLLWNLGVPLGSRYDHIRVTNGGESISTIVYINANELVAYESTRSWNAFTNVKALKKELDRVRAEKGE